MANVVITFAAKTRDFLRGTRDVERSTEDIADALADAAKDSDKFERQFTDAMKDAERSADKASKGTKDAFAGTPDALGEIGADSGQEFTQNIGESIASGDIDTILQDVVGGVVGGLKGPLGIAAAGIAGVAILAFNQVRAEAERLTAWYESWEESFMSRIQAALDGLTTAQLEADYQQWVQDNLDLLREIKPELEDIGVDSETFARALFAGGDAASELVAALEGSVAAGTTIEERGRQAVKNLDDQASSAQTVLDQIGKIVDEQENVVDSARDYADFIGEDVVGAVEDVTDTWMRQYKALNDLPDIQLRATIDTRVTGEGRAYLNPNSVPYSTSNTAANGSRYRNGRR